MVNDSNKGPAGVCETRWGTQRVILRISLTVVCGGYFKSRWNHAQLRASNHVPKVKQMRNALVAPDTEHVGPWTNLQHLSASTA